MTGTVAIVAILAGRSPEVRRMTALQRLARKAHTAEERHSAMTMLTLDKALAHSEIRDATALIHTLRASNEPEPPHQKERAHAASVFPP